MRYSDVELKIHKFDKLLATQASFNPQVKIKTIKTKLPTLRTYDSVRSMKTTMHSHGKIAKMNQNINFLKGSISELNEGLDVLNL